MVTLIVLWNYVDCLHAEIARGGQSDVLVWRVPSALAALAQDYTAKMVWSTSVSRSRSSRGRSASTMEASTPAPWSVPMSTA